MRPSPALHRSRSPQTGAPLGNSPLLACCKPPGPRGRTVSRPVISLYEAAHPDQEAVLLPGTPRTYPRIRDTSCLSSLSSLSCLRAYIGSDLASSYSRLTCLRRDRPAPSIDSPPNESPAIDLRRRFSTSGFVLESEDGRPGERATTIRQLWVARGNTCPAPRSCTNTLYHVPCHAAARAASLTEGDQGRL